MVDVSDLTSMGRRRFLSTLGKLGVSAATLNYITKDALADLTSNPEKEVPRLLGLVHTNHDEIVSNNAIPKREPKFYTIPREQWARTESTHNAAARLGRIFDSEPWIDVSVSTRGGGYGISVNYTIMEHADGSISTPDISLGKAKEMVPAHVKGEVIANGEKYTREDIRVDINKNRAKEQGYFDSNFRPVPGGCQAEDSGPWTTGTPATALQDNSQCWVVAAHCFNRTAGKDIFQPEDSSSSNKIGESRQYTQKGNGDVGTIVSTGPDNSYNIANNDGTYGWQISGVLSRDKLKDMQANYEELYQQGKTTGRNSGTILNVNTSGEPEKVDLNVDTDTGDSGGLYFHVTPDDLALIGAIHHAAIDYDNDDVFDEARGHIMAWAEEVLDVRV